MQSSCKHCSTRFKFILLSSRFFVFSSCSYILWFFCLLFYISVLSVIHSLVFFVHSFFVFLLRFYFSQKHLYLVILKYCFVLETYPITRWFATVAYSGYWIGVKNIPSNYFPIPNVANLRYSRTTFCGSSKSAMTYTVNLQQEETVCR